MASVLRSTVLVVGLLSTLPRPTTAAPEWHCTRPSNPSSKYKARYCNEPCPQGVASVNARCCDNTDDVKCKQHEVRVSRSSPEFPKCRLL